MQDLKKKNDCNNYIIPKEKVQTQPTKDKNFHIKTFSERRNKINSLIFINKQITLDALHVTKCPSHKNTKNHGLTKMKEEEEEEGYELRVGITSFCGLVSCERMPWIQLMCVP